MDRLPKELLLRILGYLEPNALTDVGSTCHILHTLSEHVWAEMIEEIAGAYDFIPRIHSTWRQEIQTRSSVLSSFVFERIPGMKLEPDIGEPDGMYYDSERQRAFFAKKDNGKAVSFVTSLGEKWHTQRLFKPHDAQRQPLVNFMHCVNVGVLIGFIDGKVALAKLGKAGSWQTHHFTDLLSARITACTYSGQLLVTADANGQIQCWDTERLILVKRAQTQLEWIQHMSYENDTLLVVDCVIDDDLDEWPYDNASLEFFSMPNMLPTGGGAMHRPWGLWAHCKFLTEQRVLLVNAFVTVVQDFGVEGHPVREYTSPSNYRKMYVAVSPPGPVRLFAVSSGCGTICIYKTADTKPVVICKGNGMSAHDLDRLAQTQSAMAMSMTILAVGCWDGSVLIFDIMTGEKLHASCPPISWPLPESYYEMGDLVDEHGWWPRVRNIFLHPYRPRGLIDHHYAATTFNLEFCWDYDELVPVYDVFGHLCGWKRRFEW